MGKRERGTGNGERGMGNGEWVRGNGEWGMGNVEWGIGNGYGLNFVLGIFPIQASKSAVLAAGLARLVAARKSSP